MTEVLSIHSFPEQCVLGSRIELSERDRLGAKTGAHYKHREHLRGYVVESMGWFPSVRGRDVSATRGADAWRLAFILLVCPYAIDLRTYVPAFFSDSSRRKGKPDLLLEWVLTVELKARPGVPHLHAIYTEPISEAKLEKVRRLGVTTELLRPDDFPRQVRLNAMWCYVRLLGYQVDAFNDRARALAVYLNRSGAKGTLRRRLGLARRHVDIVNFEQDKCRIFAAAVLLGYVFVDHEFALDMEKELHLR